MKHVIACGGALIMTIFLARGVARGPSTRDAVLTDSCGLTDDGVPFDVSGRKDGIYAVRDDRVAAEPMATLDHAVRTGGRSLGVRLDERDGDVTKIALVVGGELASIHKLHPTIDSAEIQVTCCNPHACDRLTSVASR